MWFEQFHQKLGGENLQKKSNMVKKLDQIAQILTLKSVNT